AAARAEHALPLRIPVPGRELRDRLAQDRGDRKSALGVVNGRLQETVEAPRAEALEQHGPRAHHAGHAHRLRPDHRQRLAAAPPQLLQRGAAARAAGAVEEVHATRGGLVVEAEEIAAETAVVRL